MEVELKEEKSALIICNGEIADYDYMKKYISYNQLVICVDGGVRHLDGLQINPDLILGDFDSAKKADLDNYSEQGIEILEYPPEKDFTDTELALEEATKRGINKIIFLGATGTRLDHTLANIFLLKKAMELGIEAFVANENNEIYIVNSEIRIAREEGYKLSILPVDGPANGVTTLGLYFPLKDATLPLGPARGISNEFTAEWAEISVKNGLLLVIKARD